MTTSPFSGYLVGKSQEKKRGGGGIITGGTADYYRYLAQWSDSDTTPVALLQQWGYKPGQLTHPTSAVWNNGLCIIFHTALVGARVHNKEKEECPMHYMLLTTCLR